MADTARHPFLDTPEPHAFAHRGACDLADENTMEAFEAAVQLGYCYIETDVRVSRDGVLVAFHDPTLDRVVGTPGSIEALDWCDIEQQRTLNGHRIARLIDVLAAWPELKVNIDPKTDAAVDVLADTLVSTNAFDRVCIGSFSDTRLERLVSRFNDRICTSCGPMDIMRLRIASWGIPVKPSRRPRCVQIPVRQYGVRLIDQRFLDYCDTLGWPVHVWTVNDPDEMVRLLDLGVGGLMSDETQRLKALLEHRGQWSEALPAIGSGVLCAPR